MSRKAHQPDPGLRRQVETMSAYGIPEYEVSRVVGIDPKTLRKHYRDELDLGTTKANAQVAGFLFNSARNGNVSAQIFWLKTRARWRDAPVELRHSGAIATRDLSKLSDEELMAMIASVSSELGLSPTKTIEAEPGPHALEDFATAERSPAKD
jgi:hypothetical protein